MFLHTYHPQPLIIQLGWLKIHWYGLIIALAAFAALWLLIQLNKKYQEKGIIIFKNKEQIFDLFFYLIISGIVGARLFELFYSWDYFKTNPIDILKIWQGGLSIHGAVVGGLAGLIIFCYKNRLDLTTYSKESNTHLVSQTLPPSPAVLRGTRHPSRGGGRGEGFAFWQLADLLAPAVVLGQAIGRWGNYFNQELYGRPTTVAWGIPIDLANRVAGFESFVYFHPIFLYESLGCLMVLAILLWLHRNRIRRSAINNHARIKNQESRIKNLMSNACSERSQRVKCQMSNVKCQGSIFFSYLLLYSILRFTLEFLRIDPQPIWRGLRLGQWLSLGVVAVGLILFIQLAMRADHNKKDNVAVV